MKFYLLKRLLLIVTAVSLGSAVMPSLADTQQIKLTSIQEKLAALEASSGGRLGVAAINMSNNTRIQYRADERFPFCSTFKTLLAAAILKQSMTDCQLLQEKINYTKEDLEPSWSPVAEKNLANGMTVSEMCGAVMMQSDNTAANILIKKLGGPSSVTNFARSIGDNAFRLDRWEPELNTAVPDDVRDTTTPVAMANSLQQLTLGKALASSQREQLQQWLKDNTTGASRIHAGVPKGWVVGDKTGSGAYGVTNDIGVIWPPHCAPIVVAIYLAQNKKDAPRREDILASATHIIISEFAQTDQCLKTA